jgi:predicted lactoylglutathione lyase
MMFVNLPVVDLDKAKAFYAALGFINEPRFTDETAAAMQWSDTIVVMLLTYAKWHSFTARPIPGQDTSEVMLCISCTDRAEVDRLRRLEEPARGDQARGAVVPRRRLVRRRGFGPAAMRGRADGRERRRIGERESQHPRHRRRQRGRNEDRGRDLREHDAGPALRHGA